MDALSFAKKRTASNSGQGCEITLLVFSVRRTSGAFQYRRLHADSLGRSALPGSPNRFPAKRGENNRSLTERFPLSLSFSQREAQTFLLLQIGPL